MPGVGQMMGTSFFALMEKEKQAEIKNAMLGFTDQVTVMKTRQVGKSETLRPAMQGEIWARTMMLPWVNDKAVVAVCEAGKRCGLQLEWWQAQALAAASLAAMDQLWFVRGGTVQLPERGSRNSRRR